VGPAGPAGPKGDKGDPGAAGAAGAVGAAGLAGASFHVVSPDGPSATCDSGEVLVSAYCTGIWTNYPLKPTRNGAACGEAGSSEAKVTIVCAKSP